SSLAVADILKTLVLLRQESVEMETQLVVERQRRIQETHRQRLAAADAAPKVYTPHGLDGVFQAPCDASAPASRRRAGRDEIAVEPLEGGDGLGLSLVRRELSGRDAAAVFCERTHQTKSSGRLRNSSSDSGFASASTFATSTPWTASRTASSEILPLRVRGTSATSRIFAGTCRGLASRRSRLRISSARRASSRCPGRMRTNSTIQIG